MARGHVDISERRLRPIYDALDNGNNKKALQEADKALKKQKDLLCAKALRGLALLRLGRMEECLVQVSEVHTSSPTDEPTLQAMSISYREMHKLERIADLYENATKAQPDNEELLSSLFMAYVRIHNYKKQQQTAMKLHKLQPQKNPYYFWAVMSIVMQAQEDPKLSQTMYLPLAERMTEKYAKEDKIEAEAEVYLYLMVLEFLGKNHKAWEIITGTLGKKLQSELDFKEIKEAELLIKLEKWPEANMAARKLLKTNPDQWQFYKDYLTSLFHLIDSNYTPPPKDDSKDNCSSASSRTKTENSADQSKSESETDKGKSETETLVNGDCDGSKEGDSETKRDQDSGESSEEYADYNVEMASVFLQKQLDLTKSENRPSRGPYLAQLELHKHLMDRNKGETTDGIGSAVDVVEQYYALFGDKPCCVADLKPYMVLLGSDQQQFVKKHLEEAFPSKTDGEFPLPEDSKSLQRHINLTALSRLAEIHAQMSVEQKLALVTELEARYQHGLKFGENLRPTEPQFADPYVLLTAHTLYDIWVETGDQHHMWRALMILEKSLVKSPANFQAKLLLIKLYCIMGAFGPCPTLYDGMEIKHVQNDSLGYIVTNHIGRLGHVSSCCSLYETMLRFFSINHKETTEYLVQSYKYGSFTKIIEFVKFREKLKNSFQYASAKTERMLIDLTMESTISRHENTEQMVAYLDVNPERLEICAFEKMVDNRDLTVMMNWDSLETTSTDHWGDYSFKEEKAWLCVRNLVMRSLCQAVIAGQLSARQHQQNNNSNAIANGDKEGSDAVRKVFENLKQELREKLAEGRAFISQPQYPLAGPSRTRLGNYLAQGFGDMYMQLCDIFSSVHTMVDTRQETLDKSFKDTLQSLKDKYSSSVSESCKDVLTEEDAQKTFHVEVLERLVLLTEFSSQASVFVGSCYRMVKPIKMMTTKKAKKKKAQEPVTQTQEPVALFEFYEGFLGCVEEQVNRLHEQFKAMDQRLTDVKYNHQTQEYSEEDRKVLGDVQRQVVMSYCTSAQEMTGLLGNKLRYLSSLKL